MKKKRRRPAPGRPVRAPPRPIRTGWPAPGREQAGGLGLLPGPRPGWQAGSSVSFFSRSLAWFFVRCSGRPGWVLAGPMPGCLQLPLFLPPMNTFVAPLKRGILPHFWIDFYSLSLLHCCKPESLIPPLPSYDSCPF